MKPKITIMIDSASRLDLLKQSVPTIHEHLKYDGRLHWVLHEAKLFKIKSEACAHWAKYSGFFDSIIMSNPHGQGMSIGNVLKKCDSKYFIHWEDDHIALRDIDLNSVIKITEENKDVNQIAFNKRGTMGTIGKNQWQKKAVKRSGFDLTTSPHWRYTPAIWRVGFIKPRWKDYPNSNNSHWKINAELKKPFKYTPDADWIIKKLGTYYLGPIGEPAYVKSIGAGFSNRTNKDIKYEINIK